MESRVVGGRAAVLLATLVACGNRSPSPTESPEDEVVETVTTVANITPAPPLPVPVEPHVVLVTIDGVRWEDVFGPTPETSTLAMPNLHRLVADRGIAFGGGGCEHDVRASGPNFVSLPGYLEIFTGRPTTCTHNYCANVDSETVVDQAASGHDPSDVAVFASWNRYSAAVAKDRKAIVMSAGARTTAIPAAKDDKTLRSLLDSGAANAGYPGWGDYRADVTTGKIALRYLETKQPRLLVIGLGDADEQAHRGDVAGYRKAIARSDEMLGDLEKTLARMGEVGAHTAVVVTTDHGRAKSLFNHGAVAPESARVFVAAYGGGVVHSGVTCAPEPMKLSHVAGAVRALLGDGDPAEQGPLADALLTSEPGSRNVR